MVGGLTMPQKNKLLKIKRREFLKKVLKSGGVLYGCSLIAPSLKDLFSIDPAFASLSKGEYLNELIKSAFPARYFVSNTDKSVSCQACHLPEERFYQKTFVHEALYLKCQLCAQNCSIRQGKRGICKARINIDGKLKSLVYGRPVAIHVDPIEKKPFYHFLAGQTAYSLATAGCPLSCKFCQNWQISQARPEDYQIPYRSPQTIISDTKGRKAPIIAFTYNEPTVFIEYIVDIAKLARKSQIRSVLISCGFMNKAPLDELCSVLDAIKIDLKGFDNNFYKNVCNAKLKPVLESIKQVAKSTTHLEIVNLVVPTLNDSQKMLTELCKWVFGELGPDVPVHFTRFHPDYQMRNLPPTPIATLELAYEIAKQEGLHYPYIGNFPGHSGNHTYCPKCKKVVISRTGFFVMTKKIKNGRCTYCNNPISGVWE